MLVYEKFLYFKFGHNFLSTAWLKQFLWTIIIKLFINQSEVSALTAECEREVFFSSLRWLKVWITHYFPKIRCRFCVRYHTIAQCKETLKVCLHLATLFSSLWHLWAASLIFLMGTVTGRMGGILILLLRGRWRSRLVWASLNGWLGLSPIKAMGSGRDPVSTD